MQKRRVEPNGWIAKRSESDKIKRSQAGLVDLCRELVSIKSPSQTQVSTENLINCDF